MLSCWRDVVHLCTNKYYNNNNNNIGLGVGMDFP